MKLFHIIFTFSYLYFAIKEAKAHLAIGVYLETGIPYQIKSPFHPSPYPGLSLCYWTVYSPPGTKMHLSCPVLHVNCDYSALYVSETGDPFLRDAKTYCGYTSLQVPTTSNYFSAYFRSSSYYNFDQGFNCHLVASIDNTDPPLPTNPPITTTKPSTNNECSCGIKGSSRIVNGEESEINEWKWQVLLVTNDMEPFCGGAIISKNCILTAAHCMLYPADSMYVIVGEHDSEINTETPHTQVIGIEQYFIHENYDENTVDNDIAIIRLESSIDCSGSVGPICLPEGFTTNDYKNTQGWLTGWGTTSYGGDITNTLQEVEVPVKTTEECKEILDVNDMGDRITENMICTYKPGYDACQGDSGGPLSWEKDGRFYVIGIVSWGVDCAQEGYPGFCTNVIHYLDWIKNICEE